MFARPASVLIVLSALGAGASLPRADGRGHVSERVEPNDNQRAGGTMRSGVLVLRLEAREAQWHPDGSGAPGASVPAFAEEGGLARIPGPLVRVRAGTEAEVSVRNALRDTLIVHGLHARAAGAAIDTVPLTLAPGERRVVRFRLDAPGTYFYWGTTMRRSMLFRTLEDAQLTGGIVVDDSTAARSRDRILVIGMWTDTVQRARQHRRRVLAVINGRSWPNTERLTYAVGDTVRWRVINASADVHPMHLHGFYFRVHSRGDWRRDTLYAASAATMAVTESMGAGTTMGLTWLPERPGNWLFHCHIPEHFGPRGPLGLKQSASPSGSAHAEHAKGGMSGLVLGIEVKHARTASRATVATPEARNERILRLLVRRNVGGSATAPFYGYALHEGGAEPPPDSGVGVGPTLDLVRSQPVRITVVNRLPEPTAVHWHGIELESYYDGVPGFSGAGRRLTPLIAPGDSFVVRFTPPRAGTFIYHTHFDEERQQAAGLAGPIVVRELAAARQPATDIPILISEVSDSDGRPADVLVNGRVMPARLEMRVGHTYRLRFVQIATSRSALRLELFRDSAFAAWRPVAKDGANLPDAARVISTARTRLGIGETYDVEVTPDRGGDMRLEVRAGLRWPAPSVLLTTLPIKVHPQ